MVANNYSRLLQVMQGKGKTGENNAVSLIKSLQFEGHFPPK